MSSVDERNARAVLGHSTETRTRLDEALVRLTALEGLVAEQAAAIANLTQQVGFLRAQVLNGGPTSAD